MLFEQTDLKVNSLLRRAGLADVPRPVLIGVALICVVLVAVALWRFWPAAGAQSDDFSVQGSTTASEQQAGDQAQADGGVSDAQTDVAGASEGDAQAGTSVTGDAQTDATKSAEIYVDVEGAVEKPGMYVLPADARIADAVSAAGGLTGKAARQGVNLAQKLQDGMQVYVPSKDETSGTAAAGASAGASGSAAGATGAEVQVNLNTATAEELQQLSGIGPALSQRIIDYREKNGGFSSVEELKEVSGIGDVRFEELKDSVCV